LSDCNVALVSTAGFVSAEQTYFNRNIKGGDFSFRTISSDANVTALIESHRSESFDHAGIRADPNLAFPLDRLRELVQERKIGRLNSRHWSFMGSITAPGRLIADSAPQAARQAAGDKVDVALLVPV
jgi:D-proline reductase (dithiol) PrdB